MLQTTAAGNLHADDGDALDIVIADDLGELVGVVHAVQLRAAYQRDVPLDEALMEGGIGISRAVSGDEQPCSVKVGRVHRNQFDLHRPLGKPALRLGRSHLNA